MEVGKDRGDTAAHLWLFGQLKLREDRVDVLFDRRHGQVKTFSNRADVV